jgi:hypothetical protein
VGLRPGQALTGLFIPINRQAIHQPHGDRLDARAVEDLATFLTGGWAAFVNTWVIEGADPLDPEFTDRLISVVSVLTAVPRQPIAPQLDRMEL